MSIFNFGNKKQYRNNNDIDNLRMIKEGNNSLRESFIDGNKNFIIKIVSQILGKSTIPKNSQEFEIGLAAFNHAIDYYDLNSKDPFPIFAEQIIKDWTIEYLRSRQTGYSTSQTNEKNYIHFGLEDTDVISNIKLKLWEFGITLNDMVSVAPSDDRAIRSSLKTARLLSDSPKLFEKLITKKDLPYDELDEETKSRKKFVERYRKYIITLSLILKSDLKILNSYLLNIETGKGSAENIGTILELYKAEALIFTFQGRFIIEKIKNTNDMKIGKQIQLNRHKAKSKNSRLIKYIALSATVLILFCAFFIYAFYYLPNTDSEKTVTGVYTSDTNISPEPSSIQPPTSTSEIQTSEQVIINTLPVPTDTPEPSPTKKYTEKPSRNSAEHKRTPRPSASPSNRKNEPEPTATVLPQKASGAPGVPNISSSLNTIRVGEKYTITMNMYGGNNATSLILYENDEVFSVKQLSDKTPKAQSAFITITAKYEGMYKYKWELVNDFGKTSSASIWVNIVAN